MCDGIGRPSTVSEALGMLDRALDHLNAADAASLPASVQAEALRALERAGAKHTAARSRVLGAFAGQAAYEDDGQGSARAWLKWQTQGTTGAAAGAVGWVRRLHAHTGIATALAAGDLSESWVGKSVPDRLARQASTTTPMRSWPRPPAAAWTWPGWPGWRRKCTNGRTTTATVGMGLGSGRCG
jgi:hypothetical protein